MRYCERRVACVGLGRQADPHADADFRQFRQITVGKIRRPAAGWVPWRGSGRRSAGKNAAGTHAKPRGRECCSATMCCLAGSGADRKCTPRHSGRSRPGGWRILPLKCVILLLDHVSLSRCTDIPALRADTARLGASVEFRVAHELLVAIRLVKCSFDGAHVCKRNSQVKRDKCRKGHSDANGEHAGIRVFVLAEKANHPKG